MSKDLEEIKLTILLLSMLLARLAMQAVAECGWQHAI
jgi:hypothetical protein